jgi:hypothetical protein
MSPLMTDWIPSAIAIPSSCPFPRAFRQALM